MAEQITATPVALKPNPYVTQLAGALKDRLGVVIKSDEEFEPYVQLAAYVVEYIAIPKNARIHDLTAEVAHLRSEIGQLGKTLDKHSPGEWHKDKESAIDCARRLLSPVRDDAATRDRP